MGFYQNNCWCNKQENAAWNATGGTAQFIYLLGFYFSTLVSDHFSRISQLYCHMRACDDIPNLVHMLIGC